MPNPAFTVLLAIHRDPLYLPLSVASVQNQSCEDFELFIVEDGAPDETHRCAEALAAKDERIKVFRFPKGQRHGEAHRASALETAAGDIITHINDDSLWFPDHLSTILEHPEKYDFGHTLHTKICEDDKIESLAEYLENPQSRERMLNEPYNVANLNDVFYTRAAYVALPEGWAPAPADVWTDLNMWRKFLRQPLKFGTIHKSTALFFDYPKGYSGEESRVQLKSWLDKIKTTEGRAEVREKVRHIHAEVRLIRKKEQLVQAKRARKEALRRFRRRLRSFFRGLFLKNG